MTLLKRSLSLGLLTTAFCCSPFISHAFNEYDKVLHFGISGIFGAATESYLHYQTQLQTPERIAYATLIGIVPGILKELYDDRQRDNSFDWGDMAANAGGALTGAIISNCINNKIQLNHDPKSKKTTISYKVEF